MPPDEPCPPLELEELEELLEELLDELEEDELLPPVDVLVEPPLVELPPDEVLVEPPLLVDEMTTLPPPELPPPKSRNRLGHGAAHPLDFTCRLAPFHHPGTQRLLFRHFLYIWGRWRLGNMHSAAANQGAAASAGT